MSGLCVRTGRILRCDDCELGSLLASAIEDAQRFEAVEALVEERRRAEQALRESNACLRATFDGAPIGQALVGLGGEWIRVNRALCEIVGYAQAELLTKTFQDITHPADYDYIAELFQYAIAHPGEAISYEFRFRHKNGSYRWLAGTGRNVLDKPAVRGIVANSRDITEQVETRHKLEAYSRELERSNQELQDFAYVASHDLQEPLRKIQAFGDRLKTRYADEQGADYLERMQMRQLLQNLISNALKFHRKGVPPAVHISAEVRGDVAELRVEDNGIGFEEQYLERIFAPCMTASSCWSTCVGRAGSRTPPSRRVRA
jgi:PAS domain S-box-containing protein